MLVTSIVRAAIAEIDGDRKRFKDAVEDLTRWALGSGFCFVGPPTHLRRNHMNNTPTDPHCRHGVP
jgi:hypothetical protein